MTLEETGSSYRSIKRDGQPDLPEGERQQMVQTCGARLLIRNRAAALERTVAPYASPRYPGRQVSTRVSLL